MVSGVTGGPIGPGTVGGWYRAAGGPSRWTIAYHLIVDVAPMFTPFAFISSIRKASYIRKLLQAGRSGDKAFDAVRVADAATSMPIRTGLIAGGILGTQSAGVWATRQTVETVRNVTVIFYMDREGRIQSYLPSDSFLHKSRGDQDVVLPAVRRSQSFFDKDGIARLSSFRRPRTSQTYFRVGKGEGNAAQHPLGEAPRSRGRRSPTRRRKITPPKCPRHKQRHWCSVTRAMF